MKINPEPVKVESITFDVIEAGALKAILENNPDPKSQLGLCRERLILKLKQADIRYQGCTGVFE